MASLSVILYCFNLSLVPGLLIFVCSWLPSDLAAVLYLRELAIATHGKMFSVKFEEVPRSSGLLDPDDPPYFTPVLI